MRNDEDEDEDLAAETEVSPQTPEELAEMRELKRDLFGMMVSVTIENDTPVPGMAEQLAQQIRVGIGEPESRIQVDDSSQDAVVGPTGLNADDSQSALQLAREALGGTWEGPTITDTSMGPVLHTSRPVDRSTSKTRAPGIHLWTGTAFALIKYAEEHA
ncbi:MULTISPECIES: hypothetical protein [Streptomyces]|uniref:hypothetical protein n=1 Tax=Streptomyces TaxID=1883 RepID=UPI000ABBB495|nr:MULTISPECIES: hypothetical protein [Streptomyces]